MKLIIKIGWRNILRNKRRTLLSSLVIGIGLASLILTDAIVIGMNENMVRWATSTFLGDAQVHHSQFRKTFEVDYTITDSEKIEKQLNQDGRIAHYAPRTLGYAMISSAANVSNVMLYGVDPSKEGNISKLPQVLVKGDFLNRFTDEEHRILIGDKLAKKLEVDLGEKVVVTVAQANGGELSQELFRVGGIFDFGSRDMNSSMVFVSLNNSQRIFGLGSKLHEIALKFHDQSHSSDKSHSFWKEYSESDNEALGWNSLVPEVQAAIDLNDYSTTIVGSILFIVVALGIINTLFMSIYERFYEFGVLKAIGTSPWQIWLMIVSEAASLAIVSIFFGTILTFVFGYYLSVYGLDYSGIEFASVVLNEPIRGVLKFRQFVIFPIIVFIFTIVVAIYPAVFAARIVPARAMKKSL